MKVGIISIMEGYPWGGSEELWTDMAEIALKKGDKLFISYKAWESLPPKLKKLQDNGASVYLRNSKVVYPSVYKRIFGKITNRKPLPEKVNDYQIIFDQNPDVILINEGAFGNILYYQEVIAILKTTLIPYFILSHQNKEFGCFPENWFFESKLVYLNAKQLFFVSEKNRKLAELLLCTSLTKSSVVRNTVNMVETTLLPFPVSDKMMIACVGRLNCDQKGQDLLIRALNRIKSKIDFQLTFYGKGDDEQYLRRLVAYLGLSDKITFAGYANDVRKIWEINQMLILPSHYEGMPISVVEAMICGRPCLVTDVAGNSEWVDDGLNGYITACNKDDVLAEKILAAFKQKNRWEAMGLAAHKKAMENFGADPALTLYEKIISFK